MGLRRHRDRDLWLRRLAELDPVADAVEVHRITVAHEFPWDMDQALSFALFRTYAVPRIGALLDRTAELTEHTQKRYEDTALLLEAVLEHGPDSATGRQAVRRVNQMHARYDLDPADMAYVLGTFVVMPRRWVDRYGWRPFSATEVVASVEYYRGLGARMGLRDLPVDYDGFAAMVDAHERAHFAPDEGGRRVADATLALLATIPPHHLLPARLVHLAARSLMDAPLLDALHLPRPPAAVRALVQGGLVLRGRLLRRFPPRREPTWIRDSPHIRGYPHGYDVARLGVFGPGPQGTGPQGTGPQGTGPQGTGPQGTP